jgi:hypothetical protein
LSHSQSVGIADLPRWLADLAAEVQKIFRTKGVVRQRKGDGRNTVFGSKVRNGRSMLRSSLISVADK